MDRIRVFTVGLELACNGGRCTRQNLAPEEISRNSFIRFRFHKNRESVNMAYLKGTARPKHCVTFFMCQFYVQETPEQQNDVC